MSVIFDEAVLKWKSDLLSGYLNLIETEHDIEDINEIGMELHEGFVTMDKMSIRENILVADRKILHEIYDEYLGLYLNEMDRLFIKDTCEDYTM